MTREQFEQWATAQGYKADAWGNLKKQFGDKLFRFKVGKLSVRYEVQTTIEATQYSKAEKMWVRLKSGYLKDLSITEENKLRGLKR